MTIRRSPILAAFVVCSLLSCLLLSPVQGQDWATKMFETTRHDFENVARGSKAEYKFTFENLYQEDIHITGVRTSCGCVTASVSQTTIKSRGQAEVLVKLNTRAYSGKRTATVTVMIDKPYAAEVQLGVAGFIRQDVVLDPGVVRMGNVAQQDGAVSVVNITHAGHSNWQIADVTCDNPNLSVQLQQTQRNNRLVSYRMNVTLAKDAPAGLITEDIKLVTNDGAQSIISVPVEANVLAALTVSPRNLDLGSIDPAVSTSKRIVIRGQQPFLVQDVLCDDARFTAQVDSAAKKIQIVTITFEANGDTAPIQSEIKLVTSLGEVAVSTSGLVQSTDSASK